MIKRRKYPESLNVNDYFEMNMIDVWDGIKEQQRATKTASMVALIAILMNSKFRTFLRGGFSCFLKGGKKKWFRF